MTIEFGYVLPAGPPKSNLASWLQDLDNIAPAIEPHFSGLWMTDHFMWEDKPTFEAWTVLSFVAARFPQFDIGSIVLGQSYRNPAMLAKMAATLQTLCEGQLILGIGAGWKENEYHAYSYDFPSPRIRLEQLQDSLEIIQRMWKEPGQVNFSGKHYSVVDAYCEPKPDPVPRLIVGGGGNTTMRLAAQYADEWNLYDAPYATYKQRVETLHQHCEALNRDPSTLRLSWFGRLVVGQTEAEALQVGAGKWTSSNALVGTPHQLIEQMQAYIDLGLRGFIIEILGTNKTTAVNTVIEEIMPHLSAK
jgi:alkanesulfonate monooxygenase SsuD/methylene tetrahydromethanopterin reductase-like flavin-dependent oxidoreductase (luciferase family)